MLIIKQFCEDNVKETIQFITHKLTLHNKTQCS